MVVVVVVVQERQSIEHKSSMTSTKSNGARKKRGTGRNAKEAQAKSSVHHNEHKSSMGEAQVQALGEQRASQRAQVPHDSLGKKSAGE